MNFYKLIYLTPLVLFIALSAVKAQVTVPVQQLDSLQRQSPRPVVFYFHTDWCVYCAMQTKQLAKDTALQNILDKEYYFVDFNAETDISFSLHGKPYANTKENKYNAHDLVKHLVGKQGEIGYPAWVITDENYSVLFKREGLLNKKKLREILSLVVQRQTN
ncbi:thioredoxin family protein [Pseudoxanthomonas sp. SGD-10]|nr:thioredoxin family protein [Pseudoxanthomonas sp. SGD-10]